MEITVSEAGFIKSFCKRRLSSWHKTALSIQSFTLIPMWGASQGFQPAAGTNFGTKQYGRVKQVTRAFIIGATALGMVFYIPIQLAPETILSWFIKDTGIVSQGVTDFRILFSTYILLGFAMLCKQYNLNPAADGVIISHREGHSRGIASNHGDPEHLWNGLGMGYTMDGFRKAVKAAMSG